MISFKIMKHISIVMMSLLLLPQLMQHTKENKILSTVVIHHTDPTITQTPTNLHNHQRLSLVNTVTSLDTQLRYVTSCMVILLVTAIVALLPIILAMHSLKAIQIGFLTPGPLTTSQMLLMTSTSATLIKALTKSP
jgi:hypothetical protein